MRAWDEFLALQEIELGIETVHRWLKPLKVLRFDAGNLYLEAKDSFHAMWFEEHMRPKVVVKLVNNNNKKIKVHLSVASKPAKVKTSSKLPFQKNSNAPFVLNFDELDPYCTYENFVFDENNLLISKLLKNLPNELAGFNPIYIHGTNGAGKTHLLMAITNQLREKGLRVLYARAETFTEHVVSAIRLGEMSVFRQAYRNNDVLIIDGLQIFSKKAATQEEFFHTFNTLHLDGKQIILSANCPPAELQAVEPRLISRFEWGIVLNLFPLNKELQVKMLQQKAEFLQFPLHLKVIDFLIETFTSSPKSLIKALEALVLRIHLNGQHAKIQASGVTVPLVKQVLRDLILDEKKHQLTFEKTIQYTAQVFGIKSDDILGKSQTKECVLSRQLAMYFCRHRLKLSYTKIGELFSKDHSTVMSSVKVIQKNLDENQNDVMGYYSIVQKMIDNPLASQENLHSTEDQNLAD